MTSCKVAIVAALEREVSSFIKSCRRIEQPYDGRGFVFFESAGMVVVCGGIGTDAARRAAEAVIALYHPERVRSVGFAGALDAGLHVGDVIEPGVVIDARDGSRVFVAGADNQKSVVTYMSVAGIQQKTTLAHAFGASAVDMEAAAVAAAAAAHGIGFSATKVISDELNFEIPDMDRFIDSRGRFKTASFALFITPRPWLWNRIAHLARNSGKAARVLSNHLHRHEQELSRASNDEVTNMVAPPAPAGVSHATAASGTARSRE
jgi:adenosylhomocysteine nucleosidase